MNNITHIRTFDPYNACLFEDSLPKDIVSQNQTNLDSNAEFNDLKSKELFNEEDLKTYHSLIDLFIKEGNKDEVFTLFSCMKSKNLLPGHLALTKLLNFFVAKKDEENAYAIFFAMTSSPDDESYTRAINFFLGDPPVFKDAFNGISECPPANWAIYLTTTENNQEKTLSTMKRQPLVGDTFIGVSGLFSLNLVAARGEDQHASLDYMIMIDKSERVQRFWQSIEQIIIKNSLRENALKDIKSLLSQNSMDFFLTPLPCGCEFRKFENEISRGESWLSTQESYEKIKRIFDSGHFIFKRLDLFDDKNIRDLSQTIKKLGLVIDTAYISNVREYAEERGQLSGFQAAMKELRQSMTNKTLVIDTRPREGGMNGTIKLTQYVRRKIVDANIKQAFARSPQSHYHKIIFSWR